MPLLPFLIGSAIIGLGEWMLWTLFQRRMEGILFPHEIDASQLRFMTLGRLRACIIGHTALMLFCLALFILIAW